MDSAVAEDTVLVAPGTYTEPQQSTGFGSSMLIMKFRVVLRSSGGAATTTLDAQGQGGVVFHSFFSLSPDETRIEGFTITGASAVFCETGSLTLADCAITGNGSLGVRCGDAGVQLVSCSVTANLGGGAGLFPTDIFGAGLAVEYCNISDNVGDGILSTGDGPTLSVYASSVSRNSGNGIHNSEFGNAFVSRCTIVGNGQAGIRGFSGGSQLSRTIISNTTAGPGMEECSSGGPIVWCCDIWGNAGGDDLCGYSNGGNFSMNPLFCEVDAGDYTLWANSPCLPGNHPEDATCGPIGAFGAGCDSFPTSVDSPGGAPAALGAPAPNPSDRGFAFEVRLAEGGAARARVRVYDAGGRLVRAIWDGALASGTHPPAWDARDDRGSPVASGVYTVRLEAGDRAETRKVSVIR